MKMRPMPFNQYFTAFVSYTVIVYVNRLFLLRISIVKLVKFPKDPLTNRKHPFQSILFVSKYVYSNLNEWPIAIFSRTAAPVFQFLSQQDQSILKVYPYELYYTKIYKDNNYGLEVFPWNRYFRVNAGRLLGRVFLYGA